MGGSRSIAGGSSRYGRPAPGDTQGELDLGDVAILPGLVNAHTHLELSYLRDQVDPSADFVTLDSRCRRGAAAASRSEVRRDHRAASKRAIAESMACGTAIVGDISNTLVTFDPLARSAAGRRRVLRTDSLRRSTVPNGSWPMRCGSWTAWSPTDLVRAGLAAHAPYSVAPLVFRAIRAAARRDPLAPCSVHLSESVEEVEFIRTGSGPWRDVPRGARRLGSGLGPARRQPRAVSRGLRIPGRSRPRRARRPDVPGRPEAPRSTRRDARHVPAQQWAHRRRRAAARGLLRVRRSRRDRHRQPGELARLERVRGAGDDASAGAVDTGDRRCWRARPGRVRERSASTPTSARSSPASVRACWPWRCRRNDDVEEYLVSGIGPEQIRWLET